jgi:hypothetical protein
MEPFWDSHSKDLILAEEGANGKEDFEGGCATNYFPSPVKVHLPPSVEVIDPLFSTSMLRS